MSIVFLICGVLCTVLIFTFGAAYEDAARHNKKNERKAGVFLAGISIAFAVVFLFSAGISWVTP